MNNFWKGFEKKAISNKRVAEAIVRRMDDWYKRRGLVHSLTKANPLTKGKRVKWHKDAIDETEMSAWRAMSGGSSTPKLKSAIKKRGDKGIKRLAQKIFTKSTQKIFTKAKS